MWFKKDKPETILSKYVSQESALDHKKFGSEKEKNSHNIQTYYYTLVYLNSTNVDKVVHLTSECVRILAAHNAVVQTIISGFIFVSFEEANCKNHAQRAQHELLMQLSINIKLVYGKVETFYENVGYGSTLRHSLIMPNFEKTIALLVSTEFGSSSQLDI